MRHAAGVWGGSGRLRTSGSSACADPGEHVAAHRQAASSGGCDRSGHAWLRSFRAAREVRRARGTMNRRCQSTDYVAGTLKRPNWTMAGGWVGLHDRPVCPARSRVAASIVAASGLCCRGRTNAPSDPGPIPHPGPPQKRDAPWQPNPAARPHLTFPAIFIPRRWPTSSMCRPRPCLAGPRRVSCRFSRPLVAIAAILRRRSASWPTSCRCGRRPEPSSSAAGWGRTRHAPWLVDPGPLVASRRTAAAIISSWRVSGEEAHAFPRSSN